MRKLFKRPNQLGAIFQNGLMIFFLLFTMHFLNAQITVSGGTLPTTVTSSGATSVAPFLTIVATDNITDFTVSITDSYSTSDAIGYLGELPSGVTTANWSQTKRAIVFKGTKTAEEWQAFLRNITITTANICSPETRKVSFIAGETFYNPINGHFYKVTASASGWPNTKIAAASSSFYGNQGYLATITSAAENTFVARLIGQNAWLGGSDAYNQINEAVGYTLYANQAASEGKYYWVTGPEKGRQMSTNNQVNISGVYQNWASREPNLSGNEDSLHMYYETGLWNDFFPGTNIVGIIEYGDMPGDIEGATPQFTKDIYIQGSSSGTITGGNITVCAGTNSNTLTLGGFTGSVVRWESSVDNFITAGTAISNTTTTLNINNISTTTYYRAVVNSTSPTECNGLVTSSAPIFVSSAVSGNVFAVNTSLCEGSDVELYLSGQQGDVLKWQRSVDNSNWTDIANTGPTLTETVTTLGTYYYRAHVQIPDCGPAVISPSKQITVVSGAAPIGGSLSSNTHFSGTNSGALTLTGYTGTISKWQRSTDGGLVWIDISNTNSTYSYSNITKETLFRVLVANGNCGSSYSASGTVDIVYGPTIIEFAPSIAAPGNEVVVTGTHLENVQQLQIGGVNATSFVINSTSRITAVVPSGATSGSITVTNSGGTDSMEGFALNLAPTDIGMSATTILENNDLNDIIGSLSATDPELSDTHSFELVNGTGDTDNSSFTISGTDLLANALFNFELKNEYFIRVGATDDYGNTYQKELTVNVTDVNESPTDITLDNTNVVENMAIGEVVGIFETTDADSGNSYSYTLTVGDGTNDADNGSFTIDGTDLKLAEVPDYETQSTYSVYINVNDGENDFQKAFTITVNDETDENGDGLVDGTFVTTWRTTAPGESITVPTTGAGYNYTVDWGDGTVENAFTANATHTYATAGNHKVSISGDFPRIYFNQGSERLKIVSVDQWGDQRWTSMGNAFLGCENFDITATDVPDLSIATDMGNMFRDCYSLIGTTAFNSWDVGNITQMGGAFMNARTFDRPIGSWDVSNVIGMNGMFYGAERFNQDIGSWDVGSVTDMSAMFLIATDFDQDISGWNVSNVRNMAFMFERAASFDQNIGSWNVTNVTNMRNMFIRAYAFNGNIGSWDVSNVTDMQLMFFEALAFDQNIGSWEVGNVTTMETMFLSASSFDQDLSSWNVGNVTNMQSMFDRAIAFDQDLSSWDISHVTNMANMFNGVTLSTTNYDSLLLGWSTLENVPSGIVFSGGNSNYCLEAASRAVLMDDLGWTITDGGKCDTDRDGVTDDLDQCPDTPSGETVDAVGCSNSQIDTDGDGTNDAEDAFPNDANEDTDTDGDGTGDNADAFPNDANEDTDSDGDGTGDNADAFPNDANEDTDSDGDGTGDNADAFPNDANEDTDSDGDGTGDNTDAFPNDPTLSADSDGDGIPDGEDAFPNDPDEHLDTDGDGVGDNADPDMDGDGIPNGEDEFPLEAGTDMDGDGVEDATDQCPGTPAREAVDAVGCSDTQTDTDGDGTNDAYDAFPNDANEDTDSDGDGTGDNSDAFPNDPTLSADSDGDGIPDGIDNCPLAHNPGQEDRDGDGLGDVCDTVVLDIARAFTPDGDGINDTWTIHNIGNYPNSLVRVFNSWGKEVFSARNYQNDWDGRYRDLGNKLPDAGSYYFQIDLEGDGKVDSDGWLYITSK